MYEPFLKEVEERVAEERGKEQATFEIAKNFLTNGVTPDVIAKSTGLPVEKIQSLIN